MPQTNRTQSSSAIATALSRKARHVPMADQMRIGIPNWRPASDITMAKPIAISILTGCAQGSVSACGLDPAECRHDIVDAKPARR